MNKVSISILDCDFDNLEFEINRINKSNSDYIHIDIMDGAFVESDTRNLFDLNRIKKFSKIPLDIHLMVNNPLSIIDQYAKSNPDFITIHFENNPDIKDCIELIKSHNISAGIAINPDTEISKLKPYLKDVDLILVMSVFPGKGGQKFMNATYNRIKELEVLRKENNFKISVDGGVNDTNSHNLIKYGSDILVSGSFLIKNSNLNKGIKSLLNR
ncbi:MAG: ribulose-phosphate 3-epimerase [Flammeovirgaceae bacterium]